MVSLPTIESSFVTHYGKGIRGYSHPEYPALRVASEILNATESYLWVCPCIAACEVFADASVAVYQGVRTGVWRVREPGVGARARKLHSIPGKYLHTNLFEVRCSSPTVVKRHRSLQAGQIRH